MDDVVQTDAVYVVVNGVLQMLPQRIRQAVGDVLGTQVVRPAVHRHELVLGGAEDVPDGDVCRVAGQRVAAELAVVGLNEPVGGEPARNGLQVLHGDVLPGRYFLKRNVPLA